MAEMRHVLQMRDRIVGDVEDAELGVCVEAGDLREGVVGNIEFFEVSER